ncbi:MAG: sugar ABC transporter permease, partial [Caldilineaceae bacterium]|nr:sugar ABC transporter permease [Caldilineaceae bacterium]
MVSLIPQGKLARKEAMWFWFFIMPWILGFIFFRGLPILVSMYLSFTQYNVASPPAWIGLENYTNLFNDRIFYQSLKVSAYYTFLSVPIGLIFSLGLAM